MTLAANSLYKGRAPFDSSKSLTVEGIALWNFRMPHASVSTWQATPVGIFFVSNAPLSLKLRWINSRDEAMMFYCYYSNYTKQGVISGV
mmetsp:Transcript_44969/g.106803  ORF Transcript_44969/g.106803 Transcript_44969/m.106803 type:complete len:89 (-) Transcript_44969:28-294(-)